MTLSRSDSFTIISIRKFGTLSLGLMAEIGQNWPKTIEIFNTNPQNHRIRIIKLPNHPQWLLIATNTWHTDSNIV